MAEFTEFREVEEIPEIQPPTPAQLAKNRIDQLDANINSLGWAMLVTSAQVDNGVAGADIKHQQNQSRIDAVKSERAAYWDSLPADVRTEIQHMQLEAQAAILREIVASADDQIRNLSWHGESDALTGAQERRSKYAAELDEVQSSLDK